MSAHRSFIVLAFILSLAVVETFAQGHGGGGGGGGHSGGGIPSTPSATVSGPANRPTSSLPAGPVQSQYASSEGKLEYRTETILIQVPVIVTDKSGKHIHGLSKEDFRVLENGKEQTVSSFEEIVATNSKILPPAPKPGEFSNLTLSEREPRTVTVIALDTVNTPFLDQTWGRRELVKYLAKNIDTSQVLALMIITSHGIKIVQGLTGDPVRLLEALKKVSGEMPANQSIDLDTQASAAAADMNAFVQNGDVLYAQFHQADAIETTLNAFRAIAWSLSGVPGRKALIWATGGFPFVLSSPDVVPGGYLSPLYEHTMQALTEAQISVYPVDVRGLVNQSFGELSKSSMPNSRQLDNRYWLNQSKINSLIEFAEMTGGKAFFNTNDLAGSFKRAADDGSSYYLLSYYLDMKNDHAGWRELKVKVDKKDTEVRARKGFFVTNATLRAEMTRNSDMSYALQSPIEGTGVPLTLKWLAASAGADKKTTQLLVRLPPNAFALAGRDQNQLNLDFALAAYSDKSKDGKPTLVRGRAINPTISAENLATVHAEGIHFTDAMDLAPGQYSVRVVVRDNVNGKIGSVTAPLTVN